MKKWNKRTQLVVISNNEMSIMSFTPIWITPLPKSQWPKKK